MPDIQTDKIIAFKGVIQRLFHVVEIYGDLERKGFIKYTVNPEPYLELITNLLKESNELLIPYISNETNERT